MKNVKCDLITGHPTAQLIIGLLLRNPRHRIGSGRTGYYQLHVCQRHRGASDGRSTTSRVATEYTKQKLQWICFALFRSWVCEQ